MDIKNEEEFNREEFEKMFEPKEKGPNIRTKKYYDDLFKCRKSIVMSLSAFGKQRGEYNHKRLFIDEQYFFERLKNKYSLELIRQAINCIIKHDKRADVVCEKGVVKLRLRKERKKGYYDRNGRYVFGGCYQ